MPHNSSALDAKDGPIIMATFTVDPRKRISVKGETSTVPAATTVRALIDTGAESSSVDGAVAERLGIRPIGTNHLIKTPASNEDVAVRQYAVCIEIPSSDIVTNLGSFIVNETPLAGQHIEAILGRDVLCYAMLVYDGPSQRISLSF